MLINKEPNKIIYNDINSKKRRELISNKLIEFNQAQSKKVVECDLPKAALREQLRWLILAIALS